MPYKQNDLVRQDVARRLTGGQIVEPISATLRIPVHDGGKRFEVV